MELVERQMAGGIIIVDISGQVDLYDAPEIRNYVLQKIDEGMLRIVLNFRQVSYIDSSGIGALISSRTALQKLGGTLKIFNLSGNVRKVFDITKLARFFEIFEDEQTSLQSFAK